MLTILALDPATTTGWACSDGTSGAEDFGVRHQGVRLEKLVAVERHAIIGSRLQHWLEAKLTLTQAGVLLVERQLTHHTPHLLIGLRMVALMAGWRRRLMVEEVNTGQWRPWAKASGWWAKSDEADARALLGWWVETRLPRMDGEQAPASAGASLPAAGGRNHEEIGMKTLLTAAAFAALLMTGDNARAEGGWSSSQMSNPNGDRGQNATDADDRDRARDIYNMNRLPSWNESWYDFGTDSDPDTTGGVGDLTGHSAQMGDKALPD